QKKGKASLKTLFPSLPASEGGFDDRYRLVNRKSLKPLGNTEYAIVRQDGTIEHGITDAEGQTHLLSATVRAESIKIHV
ncbi:hypothetical protein, partial [Paraburkholderia sp. J76]|uniref:hypothetical protein n=1 Tax=Paraburkholderia sp. J76 TaxID=2805439 RepID=UPI002ABD8FE5